MLAGRLEVSEGEATVILRAGDCLAFGAGGERRYRNPGRQACRYLVAIAAG